MPALPTRGRSLLPRLSPGWFPNVAPQHLPPASILFKPRSCLFLTTVPTLALPEKLRYWANPLYHRPCPTPFPAWSVLPGQSQKPFLFFFFIPSAPLSVLLSPEKTSDALKVTWGRLLPGGGHSLSLEVRRMPEAQGQA